MVEKIEDKLLGFIRLLTIMLGGLVFLSFSSVVLLLLLIVILNK